MAFPASEKDLEVSIAYGANLASSLPGLTYSGNLAPTLVRPRLTITRGRIAGATRTQPTSIAFELKNPAGIFSPRNISGPNYGRLRRNTPVRVRLDAGSGLVTRGIAYMPDWPTRWTGPDIDDRIPMQASGAMRRLGTAKVSKSALRRSIPTQAPAGYWPMEDGSRTTVAASGIVGVAPLKIEGTVNFASSAGPPGSGPLCDGLVGSIGALLVPDVLADGTQAWQMSFVMRPGGPSVNGVVMTWQNPVGQYKEYRMYYSGPGGNYLYINRVINASDSTAVEQALSGITVDMLRINEYNHIIWKQAQVGADTVFTLYINGVLFWSGTKVDTSGPPRYLRIAPYRPDLQATPGGPVSIGHFGEYAHNTNLTGQYQTMLGYPGELAAVRFARLCAEEGFARDVLAGPSEPMGPQLPGQILDLLRECEDSDEAAIVERRTGEIGFNPRSSRYNQPVAMTVNYLTQITDLVPDDDDRDLVNSLTVTRIGGSSALYERTDGPLGTDQAAGVDRYPDSLNRSLATDDQPIQHASYIVNRGTVDEPRFTIVINLVADPELIPQWLNCDIGSRILATNPPAIQVGPAPLDLVIEGYTELLDGVEWLVTIYATPYRINEVLQIETGTSNRSRIPAGVSTLDATYTAAATSLMVVSPGVKWIDSIGYAAQFPFIVEIAGEAMTCTGIVNYLNANPYFETTASPWTAFGGAATRSTAQFHQGGAALLLTPDGIQAFPDARSELVPGVTAGAAYLAQAWVRCVSSRNVGINILWRNAGGAVISTSTATVAVTAATWTLLTITATAPALTTQAQVTVSMSSTPPVTDLLYVDEAMLVDPLRQVFTVQRGLHGVSKTLPSGSAVQLWRAPVIAL